MSYDDDDNDDNGNGGGVNPDDDDDDDNGNGGVNPGLRSSSAQMKTMPTLQSAQPALCSSSS